MKRCCTDLLSYQFDGFRDARECTILLEAQRISRAHFCPYEWSVGAPDVVHTQGTLGSSQSLTMSAPPPEHEKCRIISEYFPNARPPYVRVRFGWFCSSSCISPLEIGPRSIQCIPVTHRLSSWSRYVVSVTRRTQTFGSRECIPEAPSVSLAPGNG